VVGVNKFRQQEKDPTPVFRVDPALEAAQVEKLRALKASRAQEPLKTRLAALEQAARGSDNLMPHILSCSEALATVGEISDTLRGVFGEYRER
jgi:methylmalonyl-CoA mutase N-terminal domain/subunit